MSSGFYIVNDCDRPEPKLIAYRNGQKLFYVNPEIAKGFPGGIKIQTESTPIEAFGVEIKEQSLGFFIGKVIAPSSATYADGHPRKWQGSFKFWFDYKKDKPHD